MDRLIKPDLQIMELPFTRNQPISKPFKLTNLMHTMPVAVSLTTSHPSLFSFSHSFSIIPPLSTASFTISLTSPSENPPLSSPPPIIVRSSILPTGKARQEDLRQLFSRPGKHIFKDAAIPVFFVGVHAAEFLISSETNADALFPLFSKAICCCDVSQLSYLLVIAVRNGKSALLSSLIRSKADVNVRDLAGNSVMSLAIESGNIEIVKTLLDSGFEIDSKEQSDLFLHDAASLNRVDLLELLRNSLYVDGNLEAANSKGQTALHIAAIHGHMDSIKYLVLSGIDPYVTDSAQWTPLHYSAHEGHLEAVEFFLQCSYLAKYAITDEGKTAFALALEKGHLCLYDMLQLGDLLQRAARVDDYNAIRFLLVQGAEVNGMDQNGWTALHRAAFKGHLESVKVLIRNGAVVDVVDGAGYTAVMRAIERGNAEVAMYLLSHGARASLKGLKENLHFDLESRNHPTLVNQLEQEMA